MHGVTDPSPVTVQAQVAYGSADGSGSSGGWQVKQVVGEVDADTLTELTVRMATTLDPVFAMPEYPVAGLPVRMMASLVGAGDRRVAVWHSYPAGRDASARPGNVFTHCALLAPSAARPSMLWGCPQWRMPFGAQDVAATSLPVEDAFEAVSPFPELAEFISDPDHWRIGTLAVLADAVHHALNGGPVVVLEVDDHIEAARWIAAISLCTDGKTAQRINFSTYERARDVEKWRALGLHVVGVPRADDEALRTLRGFVVIDVGEGVGLGDWRGAPHEIAGGGTVEVTPWSGLVLEACSSGEDLIELADSLDAVRESLPEEEWEPAWPLALLSWSVDDPNPGAAQVLARSTPARVVDIPGYYSAVASALGYLLGNDQTSRVSAFSSMLRESAGLMQTLAVGEVVAGAVADPVWLGQHGGEVDVPAGLRPQLTAPLHQAVLDGLQLIVQEPGFDLRQSYVVMRAMDLLAGVDWCRGAIEGRLIELSERLATYCVKADPDFDQVVAGAGEASRSYLREALIAGYGHGKITERVLDLLGCTSIEFLAGPESIVDGRVPPLVAEAAEAVCLRGANPELLGQAQYLVLRRQLDRGLLIPTLRQRVVMSPLNTAILVRAYPGRVAEGLVAQVVANNLDSPEVAELATAVRDAVPHSLARLDALWILARPITGEYPLEKYVSRVANLTELATGPDLPPGGLFLPDLIKARSQAITLAWLIREGETLATFSDMQLPALPQPELEALGTLVAGSRGLVGEKALGVVAKWGHHLAGQASSQAPVWAHVVPAGEAEPVLDQILAEALRAQAVTYEYDAIKDWACRVIGEEGRAANELAKFVNKWMEAHDLSASRWRAPGWFKRTKEKQPEDN
jgi:hypothetical protein